MTGAVPRYEYELTGRDYVIVDRESSGSEYIIARTPHREMAQLFIDTLNARG